MARIREELDFPLSNLHNDRDAAMKRKDTSRVMVNAFNCCVPFLITRLDRTSRSFF